jgi:hypothetical protein
LRRINIFVTPPPQPVLGWYLPMQMVFYITKAWRNLLAPEFNESL